MRGKLATIDDPMIRWTNEINKIKIKNREKYVNGDVENKRGAHVIARSER